MTDAEKVKMLARALRRALMHIDGRRRLSAKGEMSLRYRLRSTLRAAGFDPDREETQ